MVLFDALLEQIFWRNDCSEGKGLQLVPFGTREIGSTHSGWPIDLEPLVITFTNGTALWIAGPKNTGANHDPKWIP